jgi:hypothetical protein
VRFKTNQQRCSRSHKTLKTRTKHTHTAGALEALRLEHWGHPGIYLVTGGDDEEEEGEVVPACLAAAALPASLTSLSLHCTSDEFHDYVWRLEGAIDASRLSRLRALTLVGADGPSLDALAALSATTALTALRALQFNSPFDASRDLPDALPTLAPHLTALTCWPDWAFGLSDSDASAAWRAVSGLSALPNLCSMSLTLPPLPRGHDARAKLAAWTSLRALTRLEVESNDLYEEEAVFRDLLPKVRVLNVYPPPPPPSW